MQYCICSVGKAPLTAVAIARQRGIMQVPFPGISDRLNDVLESVDAAALGLETWPAALEKFRDLTGSRVAQLAGIGKISAAPFNWTTEAQDWGEFIEAEGVDPHVNSRRRAALTLPLLTIRDEASFDTEADSLKHPAYGEFLRRWDYPYICLAPVARSPDVTVNLSVTRGAAQGELNGEGKRLFKAVLGRVRHAVRTQEMLEQRTLERLVATFDQMSTAVFACNAAGRILACTPKAETLLRDGDRLSSISGHLSAPSRQASTWLSAAIKRGCCEPKTFMASPCIVHDANGERPLVLEIVPVPVMASDFWASAAVLVVARELDAARAAGRLARLGAATMGFTPAEEGVARDLLAGRSPAETAKMLGITVGTVRVHVRNLYAKTGVSSQLEFAALMGALR